MSYSNVAGEMAQHSQKAAAYKPPAQLSDKAAVAQKGTGSSKTSATTGLSWTESSDGPNLEGINFEDTALLTSTISQGGAHPSMQVPGIPLLRKPTAALIAAYKEALNGSHSHNLMLERFMQSMSANALVAVLNTMGVSPKDIQGIQDGVRTEALARIEQNLEQWAKSQAMTEIV